MKYLKKLDKLKILLEDLEKIDFPLKKYMIFIKNQKIKYGKNIIEFDFKLNELDTEFPHVIVIINWIKNNNNRVNVATDILSGINSSFKEFNITINFESIEIDDKLYSAIQHELKHVLDITDGTQGIKSWLKNPIINKLKSDFKNTPYYIFAHNVYECLEHELNALNSSIYELLRWLKTYDREQIKNEFENTYVYKSLMRLINFNAEDFIKSFQLEDLLKYTNKFIYLYKDFDMVINKEDIFNFYKYWENEFKTQTKNYLTKAYEILDELIQDKRPYMEMRLTTLDFGEYNEYEEIDKYKQLFVEKINKLIII